MSQLDTLCARMRVVDLTLMVMIEDAVGVNLQPTALSLARAISGAPPATVDRYLGQLCERGALEKVSSSYRLTPLGAAALERLVDDWEPAASENERREAELARASRTRS
jgi:DNA-binding IclR family transcriptional regulator